MVRVVVVDNGTGNNTRVKKEIGDTQLEIYYLETDGNVGFSKGNNYGYAYCKKEFRQDFIIIINNDVFIKQKKFLYILMEIYKQYPFYVAGPDIVCERKGIRTNPMTKEYTGISRTRSDIEDMRRNLGNLQFFIKEYYFEMGAYRVYKSIFRRNRESLKYDYISKDPLLHGACLIFSEKYIDENDKAFEPEVFLYGEENYLQYRCHKNGWGAYYFPMLHVNHIESGSDRLDRQGFIKFRKKYHRQLLKKIQAAEKYLEFLEDEKRKSDEENPFYE